MKVVVEAGTHLGIVSCFGEKEFEVDSFEDLVRALKKEFNIRGKMKFYIHNGILIFYWVKGNRRYGWLEWRVKEVVDEKEGGQG